MTNHPNRSQKFRPGREYRDQFGGLWLIVKSYDPGLGFRRRLSARLTEGHTDLRSRGVIGLDAGSITTFSLAGQQVGHLEPCHPVTGWQPLRDPSWLSGGPTFLQLIPGRTLS